MLLQRASAGSGKTFRLAKTYIRLFISHRNEPGGNYILLPDAALRESHSHILGVTFTNKATNEMKARIVNKLAALAATHPEPGFEPAGWKAPDYLLDFTGENPGARSVEDDLIFMPDGSLASRRDISRACRSALRILLNDYGHFNISTIDTFFQGVLRTFAYELRLNDNYHVELNDDYLAQIGVDQTLSAVNRSPSDTAGRTEHDYIDRWVRNTIADYMRRGEDWNIFRKSDKSGIYSELLSMAKKMSGEAFRLKAAAVIEEYFSDTSRFTRFYEACSEKAAETETLFKEMKRAYRDMMQKIIIAHGDSNTEGCFNGMAGCLSYIESLRSRSTVNVSKLGAKLLPYYQAELLPFSPASDKYHFLKKNLTWRDDTAVTSAFCRLGQALFLWQRALAYWQPIMARLHYMSLLHFISRNIEIFRNENNIIPLSDTNEILHRIISREDTPFIYERIGSRLDHYLLDEFQDTSVMQWENLRPLLEGSTATGKECLVIGDVKQSIYRFRNAEPEILGTRVAGELQGTRIIPAPGTPQHITAEINSNWRSTPIVVRANNTFFSIIPRMLDSADVPFLQSAYADAVQNYHVHPASGDSPAPYEGYVRISFGAPLGAEVMPEACKTDSDGSRIKLSWHSALGYMVDDLRSRGYRLSDIAILVNRNTEGAYAISSLMDHSKRMKASNPEYRPIEILSEESLKVEDSAAVRVILAVLRAIARGFRLPEDGDDELQKQRKIKHFELAGFVANFHSYLARNPGEPIDSVLKKDLDEMLPPQEIQRLLDTLPSTALPAVVEAVAVEFTSTMGSEQAAYISAFQDAVLEYCESYPADIASFLSWWDESGHTRTIGAPEGVDALRVMTIHKSKGLEFPVVLIPKADWSLTPINSKLWRELFWVKHTPAGIDLPPEDIPSLLPIMPNASMRDPDSPFHDCFAEFERQYITDHVNKTYVAFTRAVKELHVCTPVHAKKTESVSLGDILSKALSEGVPSDNPLLLCESDLRYIPKDSFEAGSPQQGEELMPDTPAGPGMPNINADVIIIDRYARQDLPPAIVSSIE